MSGPSTGGGLLGQLAVSRGLLTPEQLRSCLEIASRGGPARPLGEILVAQGLLTPAQVQGLLAEQAAMPPPTLVGAGAARRPAATRNGPAPKEQKKEEKEIDLTLSEDEDIGSFEIEAQGESRVIANPVASAAPAPAAAAAPAPVAAAAVAPAAAPHPSAAVPTAAPAPSPAAAAPHTPSGAGAKYLADLVAFSLRAFASDLHLHPGQPVTIRQHGRLMAGNGPAVTAAAIDAVVRDVLSPAEGAQLAASGELETTFAIPGGQRCRLYVFREAPGHSAILRVVPQAPPSLSQLGLPTTIARYVNGQGLVLLAGPRGCGKTWTLAALVDLLNAERQDHIVCIERPIEFVHASKRCIVTQREVPTHAASVARGVRAALHEDPDVLVIGEIEDAETAQLALQAAEGGRLVLATFAAQGAARAVARLLGLFPADQHAMAGAMLAGALRAVIAQRLVTSADASRRAAICEVLDVDAAAAALISEGRTAELVPAVGIDQALAAAVRAGAITREEARLHAERAEAFS